MKALVAYFSAESGRTKKAAEEFAGKIGADLFEIVPEKPYSAADLKYMNPLARCNREFAVKKDVPVGGKIEGFENYDRVYIGFPIWYRTYPRVVASFLDLYDFSGKKIRPFCTNDEGTFGISLLEMQGAVKGAEIANGLAIRGVNVHDADDRIKEYVES